jgi:hypothetical protein
MAAIHRQRLAAEMEGDFVVFLIGIRINKPWKVHKWLPAFLAMPKMLKELEKHPEIGLLGYKNHLGLIAQYWRSFEHLEAYARNRDAEHFPAWVKFNKRTGSNGDVGIWHETYKVSAGAYEAVYNNMPAIGLGKAGKLVTATGRRATAPGRIGASGDDKYPEEAVDDHMKDPTAVPDSL